METLSSQTIATRQFIYIILFFYNKGSLTFCPQTKFPDLSLAGILDFIFSGLPDLWEPWKSHNIPVLQMYTIYFKTSVTPRLY